MDKEKIIQEIAQNFCKILKLQKELYGSKICTHCLNEYPLHSDYWNVNKNVKDGFRSECKQCTKTKWKRKNDN